MSKIIQINRLISGSRSLTFILGFVTIYTVGLLGLIGVNALEEYASNQAFAELEAAPSSDWFLYKNVEYVGGDKSGLVFESTRDVFQDIQITWVDTLKCTAADGSFKTYSFQVFEGDMAPEDGGSTRWVYSSSYPEDTTCFMESDINGTVNGVPKTQEVIGEPFVTPRG